MEWHERLVLYTLVAAVMLAGLLRMKLRDEIRDLRARVELLEASHE